MLFQKIQELFDFLGNKIATYNELIIKEFDEKPFTYTLVSLVTVAIAPILENIHAIFQTLAIIAGAMTAVFICLLKFVEVMDKIFPRLIKFFSRKKKEE